MMALNEGGWKASKLEVPPAQQLASTVRRPKVIIPLAVAAVLMLLWMSMGSATGEMQRYVRFLGHKQLRLQLIMHMII